MINDKGPIDHPPYAGELAPDTSDSVERSMTMTPSQGPAMTTSKPNKAEKMCELCGEPMPAGEEMFKYHGYSGPCPVKPGPVELWNPIEGPSESLPPIFSRGRLMEFWKQNGGAVDKKGHAWIEVELLVPLLNSIIERAAPHIVKERGALLPRPSP